MARRLAASGHTVTMITSSANMEDSWAPSAGWHAHELEGIHLEVVRVPYDNAMSFASRIRAFLQFAFRASFHVLKFKGDVVFATSTPLTIIVPALAAKLYHRIPLVFEVRDLWPDLPIALGALRNPLARMASRWLEYVAYHASAHIAALSAGMARGVSRRGIPESRVTVIPNGCDVHLFDVPAEKGNWVRERLGLLPGQPLVVYTGSFGLINGVGYLVDVAAVTRVIATEVRFLLVGHGAEDDKVTAQADRVGVLNDTLWIWPPLPKAKVPELLAAATIATSLFIPMESMWNNSANKFFDALAAGKPIAINYSGWQADLLRENAVGVVLPPDAPEKAALLLSEFLHDPGRLERASAASRRLANDVFHRDLLYARLERVLEAAAEKRPIGGYEKSRRNPGHM
jgi:glycosyltransferase involved in cell wall biosynthesis